MINNDFEIAALIAKYISGKINVDESLILEKWRAEKASNEQLFQKLCNSDNQLNHYDKINKFNIEKGWGNVNKRIKKRVLHERIVRVLTYAAIILLPVMIVGSSFLFFPINDAETYCQVATNDINIGEAKAILTLESGEVINITSALDVDNCDRFTQQDSSTIHFQNKNLASASQEIKYNTIEIPRGGEYKLILSDGTKVHMNSMSSLRFPVNFSGNCRKVELTGEAYFEVARAQKPFIVDVNGMHVEVLGTVFNVSAYPDEDLQTTLVSGSVKLHTDSGDNHLLKPSQQATLSLNSSEVNIQEVNIETYTSWINGLIHFKDERLEDIMRTLSRWYDMEVIYKEERIKSLRFGCHIDKYTEIIPFIDLIKKTERVKAKIDGKTIIFYN